MKLQNITKSKILKKEISFGVGIRQARTVDIGKIMKTCGYDWLFIDLEHNSMDIDMQLRFLWLHKIPALLLS